MHSAVLHQEFEIFGNYFQIGRILTLCGTFFAEREIIKQLRVFGLLFTLIVSKRIPPENFSSSVILLPLIHSVSGISLLPETNVKRVSSPRIILCLTKKYISI
jgi:hypothetical protein